MISFIAGLALGLLVGAFAYWYGERWYRNREFKKYLEVLRDRGFDDETCSCGEGEGCPVCDPGGC